MGKKNWKESAWFRKQSVISAPPTPTVSLLFVSVNSRFNYCYFSGFLFFLLCLTFRIMDLKVTSLRRAENTKYSRCHTSVKCNYWSSLFSTDEAGTRAKTSPQDTMISAYTSSWILGKAMCFYIMALAYGNVYPANERFLCFSFYRVDLSLYVPT